MKTRSLCLLLTLPLLLVSAAARAHTWECPLEVQAADDGSFQFDVVLIIEEVSVWNGGYTELGIENVDDVNTVADGFCIFEIVPGTELRMTVQGTLTDPELPGLVYIEQFVCPVGDGPDTIWEQNVTILPIVVSTEQTSFGTLKATFVE